MLIQGCVVLYDMTTFDPRRGAQNVEDAEGAIPRKGSEQKSAILEGFDLIYGVKSPKLLGQVEVLWEDSLVKASAGHLKRVERIRRLVEPLGVELRGAYMSGNGLLGILKHELATREGDLIGTGN